MSDQEYEHVENKQSLGERHEAAVTVAAFATASGGIVRFGISAEGSWSAKVADPLHVTIPSIEP